MGWPGPQTHRQFEAWRAWRAETRHEPSLTDHYIMLACSTVARSASPKSNAKPSDFRLVFEEVKPAPAGGPPTQDYYLRRAMRRSGGRVRVITADGVDITPPRRATEADFK